MWLTKNVLLSLCSTESVKVDGSLGCQSHNYISYDNMEGLLHEMQAQTVVLPIWASLVCIVLTSSYSSCAYHLPKLISFSFVCAKLEISWVGSCVIK